MGAIFYEMGFLASKEINEHSASDLIGSYVGQTAPKTRKIFENSLGRVLFIDEAYRLGTGQYGTEATDEMVTMLTSERFASKLIVILAGYEDDMNRLMVSNTGLSSRFEEELVFENIAPGHCKVILSTELKACNARSLLLDSDLRSEVTSNGIGRRF